MTIFGLEVQLQEEELDRQEPNNIKHLLFEFLDLLVS